MHVAGPVLLIDIEKCKSNIKQISRKAILAGLDFRPHMKTHQSLELGELYRAEGVRKIAVSSLEMAEYFATEWDDILVTTPINPYAIELINKLANKIDLHVCIERKDTISKILDSLKYKIGIYIEIDTGYGRTGIESYHVEYISEIAHYIETQELLTFSGLMVHDGHTYQATGAAEVRQIALASQSRLEQLAERIVPHYPDISISVGDTPSCSLLSSFGAATEIRPGNFIFYDLTQFTIGSCRLENIAVCLACPVIGVYPNRNEVVIHGGAVHFSKDSLAHPEYGTLYGLVVRGDNWGQTISGCYLQGISQEHGMVKLTMLESYKYNVGDTIYILPVHSCLTADCMPYYLSLEGQRIGKWRLS